MKTPSIITNLVKQMKFPSILSTLLLTSISLHADDLYWIPSSGADWDTSTSHWSTNSAAPTGDTPWTAGATNTNIAIFRGPAGDISAVTNLSAGGLRFDTGTTTITGDSTLRTFTFTGSTPEIHVANGATATLGANLQIMGDAKTFTKTGAGILEINYVPGNNYYFGTISGSSGSSVFLDEGTLRVNNGGLSNTQVLITTAEDTTLEINTTLNIGGLSGSGLVTTGTSTSRTLYIRGVNETFSGVLSGSINLAKINGTGKQTLSGTENNTYTGTTSISIGELILAKTNGAKAITSSSEIDLRGSGSGSSTARLSLGGNNQISNVSGVTFSGTGANIFGLNGYSTEAGVLKINGTGTYTIDFGENTDAQILTFAELNSVNGNIDVINFDLNFDELRFMADPTPGLNSLTINGLQTMATEVEDHWNVTVIPEASSVALLGLTTATFLGARRIRKNTEATAPAQK